VHCSRHQKDRFSRGSDGRGTTSHLQDLPAAFRL